MMNKLLYVLLAAGLAMAWVGCQKPAAPPEPGAQAGSSQESQLEEGEFTLVSLKVPNMT